MSLRGVLRVGEVAIRVMDMQLSRRHYGDRMGLHEVMEDAEGRVYYKAWDEHDHHSIILRQADSPGIDYFAFKVYDDRTLTQLEAKIQAFGLTVQRIAAGVYPKSGRRLQFVLPSGHTMQFYAEKEQVGNTLGTLNPGVIPDEGIIRGFNINRLDHLLLGGINIDDNVRLFTEVFEFDLSEKLIDHDLFDQAARHRLRAAACGWALPSCLVPARICARRHQSCRQDRQIPHPRRRRPQPSRSYPRIDDLLLRPVGQPQ